MITQFLCRFFKKLFLSEKKNHLNHTQYHEVYYNIWQLIIIRTGFHMLFLLKRSVLYRFFKISTSFICFCPLIHFKKAIQLM